MIEALEQALGYTFRDKSLLRNALTHSSYANEIYHESLLSNERLEFLGDSILGMVVAEFLYRSFPDRPEGELTRMRADMVCENTLAEIAHQLDLGRHLLLGHGEEQGGGRSRNSILADAVESVLAASFLDGGFPAARGIIERLVLTHVPKEEFPAQTLTVELYREAGIRGCEIGYILADRDPVTRENRFGGNDFVRLVIPRRVYTDNHMRVIAAALKNVYDRRESITRGVKITWEAELMRHFTVQLAPADE